MTLPPNEFEALIARADLFESIRGKRLFLTGGTGFFGQWIVESFLHVNSTFNLNACMTILSRDPGSFLASHPEFCNSLGLNYIKGDIRTFSSSPDRFDFIIHAATPANLSHDSAHSDTSCALITQGTKRLLEFAKEKTISKLLFISSGAVYGPQPSLLSHIPETYDGDPVTSYGKEKKYSEQLCLEVANGRFECVIARPFAFVGPYLPLNAHFAVGNFILDCLENRPIIIEGDGTPLRSYLYAADLAVWLWTILLQGQHARTYNVGSDEALSIHDLAHLVRACTGSKNDIIIQAKRKEGVAPNRYVPSIARAQAELKLAPMCPLDIAVMKTFQWHLQNRS